MISTFVDGGSMPIHVTRFGEGAPLVFLHGFTDDGSCWGPIARSLVDDGWQIICPDARGHGKTPLPDDEAFTGERRLADAVRVLKSIGAPVPVVGHSMGALTALGLAAEHSQLVTSVVLEDPPLLDIPPVEPDVANPYADEMRQAQALPVEVLADICRRENPGWTEEEQAAWVSSKYAFDIRIFYRKQTWLDSPWQEAVRKIRCPALLITGQLERGAMVEPAAVEWLASQTNIEVAKIPDAGHVVHRDQPIWFTGRVREFLGAPASKPSS